MEKTIQINLEDLFNQSSQYPIHDPKEWWSMIESYIHYQEGQPACLIEYRSIDRDVIECRYTIE